MTGAPLPAGADADVRLEEADADEMRGQVSLTRPVAATRDVRRSGEDVSPGDVVLRRGTYLRPAAIALLAALGCARVPVDGQPRVAILTTGDELVRSALWAMQGRTEDGCLDVPATLLAALENRGGPLHLVRGWAERRGDELVVRPVGPAGAAMLRSICAANALIVVPDGPTHLDAGARVAVRLLGGRSTV